MTQLKNIRAFIFLGIGLGCLLILVLSLPQLRFLPGVPFSLETPPPVIASGTSILQPGDLISFIRGLAAVVILLLIAYIVVHLLSPEGRKRLIADFIALVVVFLLVDLLATRPPAPLQTTPAQQDLGQPPILPTNPVATFTANPPAWADWIAIAALSTLMTLLVVILFRLARRKPEPTVLEQIAQQAEIALDRLREGGDGKNAIMRCYLKMNRVVSEERHIQREQAMTPQEFVHRLVAEGLPREPVVQLTQLFEQVRYGPAPAGRREEQMAVDCLTAIVSACRTPEERVQYET